MIVIIPPFPVLPGQITASTAAESLYLAYVAGTTYEQAVVVTNVPLVYANAAAAVVTYNHRDYESRQAGNTGHQPDTSPDWWLDIGPSNRHAMFDYMQNVPTVGASPMVVPVALTKRADSLTIFRVVADAVKLEIFNPLAELIYTSTVPMRTRFTTRAYEYAFGAFTSRRKLTFLNLPPVSGATMQVTFTHASGQVSVETMCVGVAVLAGKGQLGAESDILDFTDVKRTAFGGIRISPNKNIPKLSIQSMLPKVDVDRITRLREENVSKPVVFLGIEDPADGYFDCLAVFGIFRRMPVVLRYTKESFVSFDIEGI